MKIGIPKNRKELKQHLRDPLFKNAIHLISTTFATTALGFVFWMVVTRYYASEEVGLASTIISSMNLLAMLSLLGFNVALIRFLPNSDEKKDTINSCFTLCLIAALVISAIFLLGLDIWSPKLLFLKQELLFATLFIAFTGILVATTLLNSVFISNRTSKYVLIKESIFGTSKIPIPIFLVSFGAFGVFFAWGIGSVIAFIFGMLFLFRIIPSYKPGILVKREVVNDMFHFSFWNYIANFFNMAPAFILPIMITNVLSPDMTAYFYISWMIAMLLFAIPQQASQSLFAEGSNIEEKVAENVRKSPKFILLLLIPAIIFISIFGDKFLLLFGKEYSAEGFKLLQILVISAIPFAVNAVYISVKKIRKEINMIVLVYGIVAFVTLVGSYLLLESIGLIGVGYAWILGNLITAGGIGLVAMKDRLLIRKFERGN
jgi:O-antigen/teichoic acid export membrane protein